jgi:hypothetical protein
VQDGGDDLVNTTTIENFAETPIRHTDALICEGHMATTTVLPGGEWVELRCSCGNQVAAPTRAVCVRVWRRECQRGERRRR